MASLRSRGVCFLLCLVQALSEAVLKIDQEALEWVQVLGEGWAAPLDGFMNEEQYLACLHFQHIVVKGNMVPMAVPIVLPVTGEQKASMEKEGVVTLESPTGEKVAQLSNISFFEHRREERATRTFGIGADPKHPYIEKIMNGGDWLMGGKIKMLTKKLKFNDGLDQYRLTPAELRMKFTGMGADSVFVFQLRNPVHNGHALLMQDTGRRLKEQGFKKPVLWLSPLGGWTKDDDVPLDVRMKQHQAIIKNGVFGDTEVVLAVFPSPMLYAGPREVQWHASARIQGGATHYIVGRDPAGMKHPSKNSLQPELGDDLYHQWHGQSMLKLNPSLSKSLTLLPFHFASYDKVAGKMAFFDPARKEDFVSISGTKMRKMAKEGEEPPAGFMDPEGWKVLKEFYAGKRTEL